MNDKMDANTRDLRGDLQATNGKMDENMQTLRGEMQTQRGEMQSMGLNFQAGQKAIMAIARSETRTTEHKMAAPHGRDTD